MLQAFRKLWKYASPYRVHFAIGTTIISTQYFFVNYLTAYATREIVDAAQYGSTRTLLQVLTRLIAILIPFIAISACGKYLRATAVQRIGNNLRQSVYEHMVHAPLWQIEMLGAGRGQVLSRLNHDMGIVEQLYASTILSPIIFAFAGMGAFVSVWLVSPVIAAYLLALGGISYAVQSHLSHQKRAVSLRIQELLSALITAAGECLTHQLSIGQMNCYRGLVEHTQRRQLLYLKEGKKDASIQGNVEMVVGGISLLQFTGILLIAIPAVKRGSMHVSQVLYILQLSDMIVSAFHTVGNTLVVLRGALPAVDRVDELIGLEWERLDEGMDAGDQASEDDSIRASNVRVCLTKDKQLSLAKEMYVKGGESTALWGPSGGGKSSFLKTLMGFYPYRGSILYGGRQIDAYNKRSLREKMAYVSQDNVIIGGTIWDNLHLGCRGFASENHVAQALKVSTCQEWVSKLPEGINTPLEEGGMVLSGGQRQMLAIARSLLQNKRIILFDETFSAIDKSRAVQIMRNIRKYYSEKTLIVVSHEEEIIQACDRNVYINHGNFHAI